MPSSQAAASERRNEKTIAHEPPKLKTTLKTPPKQATNPLQFVKVGPCSLYRTAQEQLQKVQEVKKIKPEVRDDPEDWQSNLDNWKSSRRKRQEHIIERVVEVKKLELEEHDRQRRRSKTFSEMMEERGTRGRKLSMSLAMYHEEDINDLSDLGIGTSSGKSSVSGDTHDDMQSVMSDRDSEIEKNHSDIESVMCENGNANENNNVSDTNDEIPPQLPQQPPPSMASSSSTKTIKTSNSMISSIDEIATNLLYDNEFHNDYDIREYDSANTATASSPEPEEYNYDGAIHGYVSSIAKNLPTGCLINLDVMRDDENLNTNNVEKSFENDDEKNSSLRSVIKVDVLKRREIFERASQSQSMIRTNNVNNNNSNNNGAQSSDDLGKMKSIKQRMSSLEMRRDSVELENGDNVGKTDRGLMEEMSTIRERLNHLENETSGSERKIYHPKINPDVFVECSMSLTERGLSSLEKYVNKESPSTKRSNETPVALSNDDDTAVISQKIKDIAVSGTINDNRPDIVNLDDPVRDKNENVDNVEKSAKTRNEERTKTESPSERSSSPDSEYRASHVTFHRSLDSLDADGSSGPDTFERVQSLEELENYNNSRYPASSSSAELLHDTDREDSGIHTADVSCSVSQADEDVVHHPETIFERQEEILDNRSNEESIITNNINISKENLPREKLVATSTSEETFVCNERKEEIETEDDSSLRVIDDNELTMSNEQTMNLARLQEISEIQQETEVTYPDGSPSSRRLSLDNETQVSMRHSRQKLMQDPVELFDTLLSTNEIPQLNLTSDGELVNGPMTFALGPPTSVEPPKEKPPPPPTELSDEESMPVEPLKRLNSTRRIKKELRTRRSDFLGIEGINDDYLERELTLTRPPDMAAILAEERRIEQLNRRSYDTDSNYERDSSHERDSGVELGHTEDPWNKQPVSPDMSQHSRQSSEPFGASVTSSEEDEITKKEREIIEVLEKEEQWRYGNNREQNRDIGERLAHKLRQLEEEKMQLERERAQESQQRRRDEERMRKKEEETLRAQKEQEQREIAEEREEAKRVIEEKKIRDEKLQKIKTEELRMQEAMEEESLRRSSEARRQQDGRMRSMGMMNRMSVREQMAMSNGHEDEFSSGEVLRVERELLQLEQEELKRRRTNVVYRQQRQLQLTEDLQEQWQSLEDVATTRSSNTSGNTCSHYKYQAAPIIDYRSSMPNLQLQQESNRRRAPPPPPPPVPPSKPTRLVEQMQRDVSIRNSRVPSADSIPQQFDGGFGLGGSLTALGGQQQMTKQTLHALSAVPRSRIVKGDQWVQRRKSDIPRGTQEYNYQHWLIQEAEQRRINEKNERSIVRKGGQQHVTGTSVPYTAVPLTSKSDGKPLPDSIIQTLTQRIQNRAQERPPPPPPPPHRRRLEQSTSHEHLSSIQHQSPQHVAMLQHQKVHQFSATNNADSQEKMLSVSGKKKCSHCGDELGRGAAMIIESLRLFYHMECFKCCVCHVRLGDGLMGTDVRVRNHKLHCHNCYSSDDGVKFSCV